MYPNKTQEELLAKTFGCVPYRYISFYDFSAKWYIIT